MVLLSSFLVQFVIFQTRLLSAVDVITWFIVHFIHAEDFSLSTKSNLKHSLPWSEHDMKQL